MIVGTAGHIDHGKTSLVKALTGVDTDRLKEEKARGISIDLGFAYLPVDDTRVIGFVDVPGHERFVHTMLAGASGIDMALLVVAADDGVMPQTREHLAILDLLGISHGIVAITKVDLVAPDQLARVVAQVREAIDGTALRDAGIVPVSTTTGAGVDALREQLALAARGHGARASDGRFRMAIDRVFTLPGIGVVVTGTVLSGTVRLRDTVMLSPSGLTARVRSLHAQNRPVDKACAGDRCALNLAGEGMAKDAIHRGDTVLDPVLHAPADRIDARLHLLATEPRPMGQWFPARLHHGAAEVGARVVLLEGDALQPGQAMDVQLVLDHPLAAAQHDAFVLRDVSAQRTIGGGKFIDLRAPARQRRTPARVGQRAALGIADPMQAFVQLLDAPPFAHDLAVFARDRALSPPQVDAIVAAASPVIFGDADERIAINAAHWVRFVDGLVARLEAFHASQPDAQGMGREKLRLAVEPRLPASAFAVALLHDDVARQVIRDGAFLRLSRHAPRWTGEDESLWQAIEPMLAGDVRFRPPRVRDVATALRRPEEIVRQVVKFAARLGLVDEVAHDHFFLRGVTREMVAIAADLAGEAADGRFTAAQFRDRLDNGRKVAIQILEFFDRHGVTLNRGTLRRMQPRYRELFGPVPEAEVSRGRESSPVGRPDFKSG